MVEYALNLDNVFHSLADKTRRDILKRVAKQPLSIGRIARHYRLTFAAISKHLQVLQKAKLVVKHKAGKEHIVSLSPDTLISAEQYLRHYENIWNSRFDRLEQLLKSESSKH